jgi:hypothetical protein
VVVRGRLDAGSVYDGVRPGLSALAQALLALPIQGEAPDHPTLHWTLDRDPTSFANFRWMEFSASGRPDRLPSVLETLAGRLHRAVGDDPQTFPGIQLDWLREEAVARCARLEAFDTSAFWCRGLARLYPEGSPLASPPWGTPTGLARVGVQDVIDFLKTRAVPRSARVVVAGDVEVAPCLSLLRRTLGQVGPGEPAGTRPSLPQARGPRSWTTIPVLRPTPVVDTVVVMWPMGRSRPSDALAARALVSRLGDAAHAGLMEQEVVRPGLALSAAASLEEDGALGFLLIEATAPRGRGEACAAQIRALIEMLARGSLGAADLARWRALAAETENRCRDDLALLSDWLLASGPPAAEPVGDLTLAALNEAVRRLMKRGGPVAYVTASGEARSAEAVR